MAKYNRKDSETTLPQLEARDHIIKQGKRGKWNYRKWSNGYVELWASMSNDSLEWTSYLSTGLYYSNQWSVNFPFAVYNPCIIGNITACGGNVGWIANISHASDTKMNARVVRNGNTGTVSADFLVRGFWKK